mmetsp:Transcript_8856/g.18891  ORF Transcript_8856/g.18891 Transcript_8856/m.18891 type:complete len:90 (+) Transcript_8856:136-405(+)
MAMTQKSSSTQPGHLWQASVLGTALFLATLFTWAIQSGDACSTEASSPGLLPEGAEPAGAEALQVVFIMGLAAVAGKVANSGFSLPKLF